MQDEGVTALHVACDRDDAAMVTLLVKRGADVFATDMVRRT